jgi:D-alanine-D-alanine ligase
MPKAKKRLDILMIFDYQVRRPRGYDFTEEFKLEECRVYKEIHNALVKNGHRVRLLAVHDDIGGLVDEIKEQKPDVVFNLVDIFRNRAHMDKNIAGVLELMDVVYTGASPEDLFVCNDKALSKKILSYHKIKVPDFHVVYRGEDITRSVSLGFPLIVKPLREEASRGISKASFVDNEKAFKERVSFIHGKMGKDAIAEEYIEGREFYISVLGDNEIRVFPLREMNFGELNKGAGIATYRAKWDKIYRKKRGIRNVFPGRLPEGWEEKIRETCKNAYRALNMKCYARFDVRVTPRGEVYIIEVNANPSLDLEDEFHLSAKRSGLKFNKLVQEIVELAFRKTC